MLFLFVTLRAALFNHWLQPALSPASLRVRKATKRL